MFGLTALGIVHTAVSLVAVVAGAWAIVRDREIVPANRLGKLYLVTTAITAATALGIYQHGGFGTPHKLAILTLAAIAIGTLAATTALFGGASRYVQAIGYTSTFLFHMIPASVEILTRLPPDAPMVTAANASVLNSLFSVFFVLFLIGLGFQLRWLQTSLRR